MGPPGEPNILGYTASGTSMDWAFGSAKIPYAFAMELRPGQNCQSWWFPRYHCFELQEDQIIPTGEEIWAFHAAVASEIIKEFAVRP